MFGKLFGRKPKALEFRLNYDPIPENAARFAQDMVDVAMRVDGVKLDYTPASLPALDGVLEGFVVDGVEAMRETLFGFGCYLGEVFVRHAGGHWRLTSHTPLGQVESLPLVVVLPSGTVVNPLGKVFKRVQFGAAEDVSFYFDAFSGQASA
jgi:hypothetical protein